MLGSIGLPELLIILGVVLLLFGARRIPEIGKALGQTIANFRTELRAEPRLKQDGARKPRDAMPQIESGTASSEAYKPGLSVRDE